jgi:hypothetical protein
MSLRRWMAGTATLAVALGFVLGGVAGAKTVSPSTWAPKFCDALSTWQDALQSSSDAIDSAFSSGSITDLKGARTELVKDLGDDVSATSTAIKSLQKAGAPSSANGSKIAGKFVTGLQSAQTLFKSAQSKAKTLSTTSLSSFQSLGRTITSDLTKGGDALRKSFSGVQTLDTGGKLAAALQDEPSCSFLASQ